MRGVYTGGEHCGVKFVLTRSGTAECGGGGKGSCDMQRCLKYQFGTLGGCCLMGCPA